MAKPLADFVDTPEQAAFRAEVRDWLGRTAERLPAPASTEIQVRLEHFRRWQEAICEAGYAGLSWSREHGGRAASAMEQAIWAEELNRINGPDTMNGPGERLAGPTIIEFGTDAQRQRFLPPILSGEELWCQLFSEPGAGSDLAGVQARAERVEGGWRIDGQKVWTGRAQIAAHGMLLARTGSEGRHAGLTYFLLPMAAPGVRVVPLKQMTGDSEFNEVFLEGVFVPEELLLGDVGEGWRLAMATLQYERAFVAMGRIDFGRWFEDLLEDLVGPGRRAIEEPDKRQALARIYERLLVQRSLARDILARVDRGETPGSETSIAKLMLSRLMVELTDLGVEVNGLAAQADPEGGGHSGGAVWQHRAEFARGMAIGGGTPQIHRNIVAERALGLPRS